MTVLLAGVVTAQAQSIVGRWKTVDDRTGKDRSIVEITREGSTYTGKIVQVLNPSRPDPLCDKCTDYRKDQKITGMTIIKGLKQDGKEFTGGEILDPEVGKTYACKLWLENGKLMVRGYVMFLYRTQTWHPVSN